MKKEICLKLNKKKNRLKINHNVETLFVSHPMYRGEYTNGNRGSVSLAIVPGLISSCTLSMPFTSSDELVNSLCVKGIRAAYTMEKVSNQWLTISVLDKVTLVITLTNVCRQVVILLK